MIILNKDESIQLYNCLFNPSAEYIENHRKALDALNDISLIETNNGFIAIIKDLDLSWINNIGESF